MSNNQVAEGSVEYLTTHHSREGGNPVPAGYKQTEVGVIPEDWELTIIDDVVRRGWLEKPMDGNHGEIHPKKSDFVDFGIPFVMANNVQNGHVDLDGCSFITKAHADSLQKGFSITGDVLLTHKATIGNTAMVGDLTCEYIMLTPQVTYYRVQNREKLNNHFLRHFMDGRVFKSELESMSGGGTRSYIGISSQRRLPIIIPPIQEQTAIANTLSDVDALINGLEKLIRKKQVIKTATMQQLLTGRTRLPQYAHREDGTPKGYKPSELGEVPEDWDIEKIGSLLSITTGDKNTQDRIDDGAYPFFVRSQAVEKINSYSFDGEGVLTAGDGVGTGKIFHYINGKFDYHQRVYLMYNFGEKVDGYFFYIYFSNNFYNRIMSMTAKSSVDSVRREMIYDMLMTVPLKEEQTSIATILSDMDEEIQALQQRLNKTCQIKQGMMQELLTGKTRLVRNEGCK